MHIVAYTFLWPYEQIWDGITTHLLRSLIGSPPDSEVLRIYLLLPLYHEFSNAKNYKVLHTPFGKAILGLSPAPKELLKKWLGLQSVDYFERFIAHYKHVVAFILQNIPGRHKDDFILKYDQELQVALEVLKFLCEVNVQKRKDLVAFEVFYMHDIQYLIDLRNDYFRWAVSSTPSRVSYARTVYFILTMRSSLEIVSISVFVSIFLVVVYRQDIYLCLYPFLYDVKAKTQLLQTDQAIQMYSAVLEAQRANLVLSNYFAIMAGGESEHLMITVTRDAIVDNTITELCKFEHTDYKKPLKVRFEGEEAEDAGGVRKEFFLLLITQLLDRKYGMFQEYEQRWIWFAADSFEEPYMYHIVGLVCGLAIYNFVIINLPFPLVLYKKLLREKVGMADLEQMEPTLYRSMQSMLEYTDDDFEETFYLTFQVHRKVFDVLHTVDLKPNGRNIRVTQRNKYGPTHPFLFEFKYFTLLFCVFCFVYPFRREFVELYVDYILNKSIEKQFSAFRAGFMQVNTVDII